MPFDQRNENRLHEEHWPIAPGTPDFNGSVILHDRPTDNDEPAFSYLPSTDFELTRYKQKLESTGNYHILLHTAWLQPLSNERRAKKIHLTSLYPFEGNITLSQARYPHAILDFVLYQDAEVYRIQDNVKLIFNKMQYIDNPLVGFFIKLSKADLTLNTAQK